MGPLELALVGVVLLFIGGTVALARYGERLDARDGTFVARVLAPMQPAPRSNPNAPATAMLAVDAGFSESVFLDWAQLIFTRYHEGRAAGDVDGYRIPHHGP